MGELFQCHVLVFKSNVFVREPVSIPLFFLVSHLVFFYVDALSQVLKQFFTESFFSLVSEVAFEAIFSKLSEYLGPSFESNVVLFA